MRVPAQPRRLIPFFMHEAVFDYAAGRTYSNDMFPFARKNIFLHCDCLPSTDSSVSSEFLGRSGQGRGSTRSNLRQNLVRTADDAMVVAPSHGAFCQHLPRILCSISIVFHSTGRFIINHQTLPWRSKLQHAAKTFVFPPITLTQRESVIPRRASGQRQWILTFH